jgi:hypothetical protein
MLTLSLPIYTNPTCYNSKSVYLFEYNLDVPESQKYATIITEKTRQSVIKYLKTEEKLLGTNIK